MPFVEKNNLFPSLKFGFLKDLGTCDALLTITNVVQKALDSGCEVHIFGLNFIVIFDRVSHEFLGLELFKLC